MVSQPLSQTVANSPMRSLGWNSLSPCSRSVGKPHFPRFTQQQRAIQFGHLPNVIPQQGDPLELAQVFAAVHPELEGKKG